MINTSEHLIVLKQGRELDAALDKSVETLSRLSKIRSTQADMWGFWKVFEFNGYANYDTDSLLKHMSDFCSEAYRRTGRGAQVDFEDFLGIGGFGEKNLRNTFRTGCRIILMLMYKHRCVILPYKFSRPKGSWLDDLEHGIDTFTPLMRSLQIGNIFNKPLSKPRNHYNPAEKKAKRLSDMSTKILLASTWFSPEDISLEDCIGWQQARAKLLKSSGRFALSPIPFAQLFSHICQHFPGQLGEEINEASTLFRAGRGRYKHRKHDLSQNFVSEAFNPLTCENLIGTINNGRSSTYMTAFAADGLENIGIRELLHNNNVHLNSEIDLWLGLERDYLSARAYEDVGSWESVFGRFNAYMFMYLPAWFRDNLETDVAYPKTPNDFNGRIFYKSKASTTGSRPMDFLEFSKSLGLSTAKPVTGKLKNFFEWIILYCGNKPGCERTVQPIYTQDREKKKRRTVKSILEDELFNLNAEYLASLIYLAPHIDDNADRYIHAVEAAKREGKMIDLSALGVVPFVCVDGCVTPIVKIDHRCLLFVKANGKFYFNPASFIFPYVLSRGGMRGQNLQWLDSSTYDCYASRNIDEMFGVDFLYINTDKIYEQPFVIGCRSAVISALDAQNAWRKKMVKQGVLAFDRAVFYEGRTSSKWGQIHCLFAHDPDTGNPIADNQYERLNCYLAFSFQHWMSGFDARRPIFVALIPKPPTTHSRHYYEWDEWVNMPTKQRVVGVALTELSSDEAIFTPLFFRVKVTPHGSRASHLTDLLKYASADVVSRTTGQTPGAASYYNRGENSLIRNLSGAFNHKDERKVAIKDVISPDGAEFAAELAMAVKTGVVPDFIVKYGLTRLYVDKSTSKKNGEGIGAIDSDLPPTIMACATHLCPHGFHCPGNVIELLGGAGKVFNLP